MGELQRAQMELDEACKCDPKNQYYFQERSQLLLDLGLLDQALEDCDATIALQPKDDMNYFQRAKIYILLGEYQNAIKDLTDSLANLKDRDAKNFFRLYFHRGECYRKTKQLDLAIQDLQKAADYKKDSPDVINTLGLTLFENGWYDDALVKFQAAIDLDDSKKEYHTNKALTLFHLGRFEEAKEVSERTLSNNLDEKVGRNYHTYGIILHALLRYQEAHESFDTAIHLEPDNCSYYHSKGLTFSEENRVQESIDMFRRAIELDPQHLSSVFHLGLMLHKNHQELESVQYLTQVINEREGKDRVALQTRAHVYIDLQDYDRALQDLDRGIQIDEHHPELYILKGLALVHKRHLNEAVENFTRAMKIGSQSPEIYSGLSLAYLKFKNYQKSLFYNDSALRLQPKMVKYLMQRSDILVEINKFSESISYLTQANLEEPANPIVLYKRGVSYYKNKQYPHAIQDLESSFRIKQDGAHIADLQYNLGIAFSNLELFKRSIPHLTSAL